MTTLVKGEGVTKWYTVKRSLGQIIRGEGVYLKAVDNVDIELRRGEILALVGESGSGKTTLGKVILGLIELTGGKVIFDGKDISKIKFKHEIMEFKRKAQIVFQDPYESLNPRFTVLDLLAEPLRIHGIARSFEEEMASVTRALDLVDLVPPSEFYFRFPHQLSGGQRQRVAIARAMILNPIFLVADEPVSMLDASIRAGILDLLLKLREERGITILYITHDMPTARHISDRIAVMYLGKICEIGPTDDVIFDPEHPYTQALIRAAPNPNPDARRSEVTIKGEIPTPINPPPGCKFRPRCPKASAKCVEEVRPVYLTKDRVVYCHLFG